MVVLLVQVLCNVPPHLTEIALILAALELWPFVNDAKHWGPEIESFALVAEL
jgi:hypothetical protein